MVSKYIKLQKILTFTFLLLMIIVHTQVTFAQGCVAIRGGSSCSSTVGETTTLSQGEFSTGVGVRYFKSFRHFRGENEESQRVEQGTEVINHSYFMDVVLNYGFTNRLFLDMTLPFVSHNRSSMYEHGGNPPKGLGERHETSSAGLADIHIGAGYWLVNPDLMEDYNYSIGLGMKLPSGKYDYMDVFYNQGASKNVDTLGVVDQSIQPGDGGFGISLEIQGYQSLSQYFTLSGNLYYMVNPRETNGVLTRSGTNEFSCPDQYAARLGAYYNLPVSGFSFYLGGRMEGVPSKDLIGGSAGFRRPGYAISLEPGVSFNKNSFSVNLSLPTAISRNRTQSYEDELKTIETGVFTQGDAAFADYLVNFSFSYRFGGSHSMTEGDIPPIK